MRLPTNQISRVIPILAAMLMFTACSKKPVNVSGQIFVVTSGRENVKMGLVGVHVISNEQFKVLAAKVGSQIKEATIKDAPHQADKKAGEALIQHLLSLESPDLKVPQLEALRKEAAAPMAESFISDLQSGAARGSEEIFETAKDLLFALSPTIVTKTDADGRFTIPVQSKVWVIASGERAVGNKKEHYLWVLPYELPENAAPTPLLIANDSEIDSLDQFYALLATQTGTPPNLSDHRKVEVSPAWAKWIETAKDKAMIAVTEAKAAKEKADAEAEKARVDPAAMAIGKAQFLVCAACHGQNAEGSPIAPPLAGSEWVKGPISNLVRIQLRGLQGPISVKGTEYNMPGGMAALSYQTDEQIAGVLTYIRNSFGNKASAVKPEQVAALRSEVGKPQVSVAELTKP